MSKSVKTIIKEMNKEISKREASRQAQNERRKLQRKLAKEINVETGEKISWKEAPSFYEGNKVESEIAKELYIDYSKLKYRGVTEEGEKRVGYEVNIGEYSSGYYRRNLMFTKDLNEASKAQPTEVTSLKKGEVHAFYAATKFLWSGTSIAENRNLDIMKAFGNYDLSKIYKMIVDKKLTDEELDDLISQMDTDIDIRKLREIYQEELHEMGDVPIEKYNKLAIENIINKTAMLKKHA